MTDVPAENVMVDGRPATIDLIVETVPGDRLRVVVQGFMPGRFVPGSHVALDGFYKSRDGDVEAMPDAEFYGYD